MLYVIIKYKSPTTSSEEPYMPLFLYDRPLKVINETDKTVVVRELNEFYTYEFKKEYIDRYI